LKLIRLNKSLKTLMNVVSAVLLQEKRVLRRMLCCIAALLLHFGATAPVLPQGVATPAVQAATLPEAPLAKPERGLPASHVVCDDAEKNSQAPSAILVSEPQPATAMNLVPAESAPSRRPWLILSAVQHSAAAFDAYSTRRAITRGAIETDPLMRPFAHSPAVYAAIQLGPAMLDIVARRMQRSRNNLWRHARWVPQSASTGAFLFSGIHDLQFAKKL
jgi:hypothetical protein